MTMDLRPGKLAALHVAWRMMSKTPSSRDESSAVIVHFAAG